MSFPILEAFLETYTRQIRVGDSEGMCGPRFITVLVRPFTAGEDAVMAWVRMQDDTRLYDIVPLRDGRDFIVFERQYLMQTYEDAYRECEAYKAAMSRVIPKQHVPTDTRNSSALV